MKHGDATVPAPSDLLLPPGASRAGKFGTQHAWAFDVPALAEFSNSHGAKSAVSAGLGDAGAQHAWACDVPGLDEFSNAPRPAIAVAEAPQNAITDGLWMATVETGLKTGS